MKELGHAVRSLARRPVLTAVIAITLALGIGGSTAIFSVVNAVLLEDLPYPDPGQVYLARTLAADGAPTGNLTPPELRPFYERDDHPIVEAAALAWSQEVQIVDAEGRAHATTRYGVTDQFFEVFGEDLELGQPFERGQPPGPIVISYQIWRDLYGADPDIVGKSIGAEGGTRQVVGVTRADFEFPEDPGYWFLMRLGDYYDSIRGYRGFVRLQPGRTGDQFRSALASLSQELGPDPATNRPSAFVVQPFLDYVVGDLRYTVTILFGAIGILLLIACINVTNLLLARASGRAREMAVREALGARRWHIARQLLTESVLLSGLGGALGVAAAAAGIRVLLRMAPAGLPRLDAVTMDGAVLAFAVGLTLATGVLVGLAPAWRLARHSLRALVNEAGRGVPGGPTHQRLFRALVVTEIALAVLLVIGAGLLVRTYLNLSGTDPGVSPPRVLTFFVHASEGVEVLEDPTADTTPEELARIVSHAPTARFFDALEERIAGLPGVTSVADVIIARMSGSELTQAPFSDPRAARGTESGSQTSRLLSDQR